MLQKTAPSPTIFFSPSALSVHLPLPASGLKKTYVVAMFVFSFFLSLFISLYAYMPFFYLFSICMNSSPVIVSFS